MALFALNLPIVFFQFFPYILSLFSFVREHFNLFVSLKSKSKSILSSKNVIGLGDKSIFNFFNIKRECKQ